MRGIDRGALLRESANHVDALYGHLGANGHPQPSNEGRITRAIINDQALLPAYPDVYRISDKDFIARDKPAPVQFRELAKDFNFYWIRFPVGLKPEINWGFNMIEVRVEFNPGQPPHMRPKAYAILPKKEFQTLLGVNSSLEVSLNEKLEFEAGTGEQTLHAGTASAQLKADVSGVAKAGAGAVFGPFSYHIKKARIDHSATGMEWVFWRIDGAEFFQEDTPELVVITQVPKQTKVVAIKAELQASRYFNTGAAPWQAVVKRIPDALFGYFDKGMPLRDEKPWDITPSL
jgi:hypothetical protein